MSPAASAILLDILSDPVARIPGFGVATPFDFPFPVAVKTGTSRHFSDNWAVAATRSFTVAVWAGNFSGKPMEGVSGVSGAGPLLHRTVMLVAQRVDPGALTPPAATGAVPVQVCALSGMRATDKCASLREWFVSGSEPQERDTWERNGTIVLPDEFAEWSQSGIQDVAVLVRAPVTSSHAHFQEGFVPAADSLGEGTSAAAATVDSRFRVLSPLDGDRYSIPPGIESRYATIPLRVTGAGSDSVTWSVDGAAFQGSRWQLIAGPHRLVVRSSRGDSVVVTITVQK
jgi:penicillin-binding protein 1C